MRLWQWLLQILCWLRQSCCPLDHFVFSSVGTQIAGTSFSITITAEDALNNTLTNYNGTNNLNSSIGTISPTGTGTFLNGVWTRLSGGAQKLVRNLAFHIWFRYVWNK